MLVRKSSCVTLLLLAFCAFFAFSACGRAGDGRPADAPTSRWSDPRSWPDGTVPASGDVTIPADRAILLDISPPPLGGVTVLGKLVFDRQDLSFTAKWIMLHGVLQVGTEAAPFKQHATITLTGADPVENVMGMGNRGIMVMGGTLDLHGTAPTPAWTRLAAHAAAGATSLKLVDAVSWTGGDELVVAPTDFYALGGTEVVQVTSRTDRSVALANALGQFRWGQLQYVTATGVSLSPTGAVTQTAIDERAEVGNLTRNIVVQGADDENWQTRGFGAQVMTMAPGRTRVDGVAFTRVGQAGIKGRYPLHWHLFSYAPDGTAGDDATNQYVRNSVIRGSSQRCIVIHGTNGLSAENNICYDIKGHAFFLEDAVERRNTLKHNLVLKVRSPAPADLLLLHESTGFRTGPSGFWLSNPDNTVVENAVADSEGFGFWLAYPQAPSGLNKAVNLKPEFMPFGVFDNNAAHSNQGLGLQLDHPAVDDAGNTVDLKYLPSTQGTGDPNFAAPFALSRFTSYKQVEPFWNRAHAATYRDFVLADFSTIAFQGGSTHCLITGAVVAGTTLNAQSAPNPQAAIGAASYHSECDITQNTFVNLPGVPGVDSGAFDTATYYLQGVDKGLRRNVGNTFIGTHPGYRHPSPNTVSPGSGHENWSLAGALWDPNGLWGPAGNYWVFDNPFLTYGTACSDVTNPVHGNDKSCAGPYYSFQGATLDGVESTYMPLRVVRNDNATEWFVDDGRCTWRLGNMRSASLVKGGSYTITFPAGQRSDDRGTCSPSQLASAPPVPRRLSFTVTNVLTADDGFLLGIEYSGAASVATSYRTDWPNASEVVTWNSYSAWKAGQSDWQTRFRAEFWRPLVAGNSLADVQSSNGGAYWQDKANNVIWVLVRGGLAPISADSTSDDSLYRPLTFVFNG